jgi:hypothetical protein
VSGDFGWLHHAMDGTVNIASWAIQFGTLRADTGKTWIACVNMATFNTDVSTIDVRNHAPKISFFNAERASRKSLAAGTTLNAFALPLLKSKSR